MSRALTVGFADPGARYRAHRVEVDAAIQRVLDSGYYIGGPEVEGFEAEFAAWSGRAHGVGVGNGTDALRLALTACDIGPGDEVITVAHTAVATVAAISMAGATPRFVDVEPTHLLLDLDALDGALTEKTRAVVAVHLYGHPIDLDRLLAWCRAHEVTLIEDCAQAHGATWRGRPVGGWGRAACYSFYPTKNLGALGDGGLVATDDAALAARIRRLRTYGWDADRVSHELGVNSRLDPLQAAILRVGLKHLDGEIACRRALAARYARELRDVPLKLPVVAPKAGHAWHLYVVRTAHRGALAGHLRAAGVGPGVHYPLPAHRHPAWRDGSALPVTERACAEVLSLPMHPGLGIAEQDRVIEAIGDFFQDIERHPEDHDP